MLLRLPCFTRLRLFFLATLRGLIRRAVPVREALKKSSQDLVFLLIALLLVVGLNRGFFLEEKPQPPEAKAKLSMRDQPPEAKAEPSTRKMLVEGSSVLATALVLGILVFGLHRARRRVVILEFRNHTGGKKDLCEGLASRLGNNLARIIELYQKVDEISHDSQGLIGKTSPSVLGDEQLSSLLQGAAGPDARLRLGVIEIPIGFLLAATSSLVRGPRLAGSLHKEGDRYILLAELNGGGLSHHWRVDTEDLDRVEIWDVDRQRAAEGPLDRLVENLACRIATSLMNLGSPRWEAIHAYTAGLRQMLAAERTSQGNSPALRRAERCFLKALEHDEQFAMGHFNLGVVYDRLGVPESAQAAFRKALETDPANSRACQALAVSYYLSDRFDDAFWFSHNTLAIDRRSAAAWNLRSTALRLKYLSVTDGGPPELRGDILSGFEKATLQAWRALCRAEWSGRNLREQSDTAFFCTANLALFCGEMELHARSRAFFRRALSLKPHHHETWWKIGQECRSTENWQEAFQAFDRVFEDGLEGDEVPTFWVYLLDAHCHLHERSRSRRERQMHREGAEDCYAFARDLMALSTMENPGVPLEKLPFFRDLLTECAKAPAIDGVSHMGRLAAIVEFLSGIEQMEPEKLATQIEQGSWHENAAAAQEKESWFRTQARLTLVRRLLEGAERPALPVSLEDWCQRGETALGDVKDRRLCGRFERWLHHLLAQAYLLLARVSGKEEPRHQMLEHALAAARSNPDGVEEHLQLGEVYLELRDFQQAEMELRIALQLFPKDDPDLLLRIGEAVHETYRCQPRSPDKEAHRRKVESCCALLEDVRDLVENSTGSRSREVHGAIHAWLGPLYRELERYDESLSNFRAASGLRRTPELWVALGRTCFEVGALTEAEEAFEEALAMAVGWEIPGTVRTQRAQALLGSALVLAEKGIRLKDAQDFAREASLLCPQAERGSDPESFDPDACLGCVLYHQKSYDESIGKLRQAAERTSAPEAWVFLARSCAALAAASTGPKRAQALGHAREASRAAHRGEPRGLYRKILAEVERQLDTLERTPAVPHAA